MRSGQKMVRQIEAKMTDDLQAICDNIYKNYKICRFTSKTR